MNNKLFKGLTLLEIMVAITIFLVLMTTLFHIYVVSAKSWLKVRQKIEVKDSAQITLTRIEREIRGSAINSVNIGISPGTADPNNAISFLSSYDDTTGMSEYDDGSGKMLWTKYIIFYLRDDSTVAANGYYCLCRKEVNIKTLSINNRTTKPLYQLPYPPLDSTPLSQVHVMADYINLNGTGAPYVSDERTIIRNITKLHFISTSSQKKVEITVNTGKPVNPASPSSPQSPEKLNLRGIVILRNNN